MRGSLASIQKALICYPLLTFGEVVDKACQLEELDGRDVMEGNKKAKTETQVSGFGDSPMS